MISTLNSYFNLTKKPAARILTTLFFMVLQLAIFNSCGPDSEKNSAAIDLPPTAEIMADNLKVRVTPNTMGAELGTFTAGQSVKVLERSASQVRVGSMNAYWYKVESDDGLKGWVYGAYLSIEADPNLAANNEKKILRIKESLIGRWYATSQSGRMLDVFTAIYPEGKITFGSAGKEAQIGKYTFETSGTSVLVMTEGVNNPLFTEMSAELRGETLYFKVFFRGDEYKLEMADKDPSAGKKDGAQK
ncbi:MAG: SH3 domain-containing protein [Leptospiraceae bacterium]|nr:SH3 domain-containing protein [Leptospiraceae bacterium]